MPFKDDPRSPRRRPLLLVIAFLITVFSFGSPLVAYADPTPSASDSASAGAKAADQDKAAKKAPAADEAAADEKTAEPSDAPSATPSADKKAADPSTTPSEDPTTDSPEPSSSAPDSSQDPSETASPSTSPTPQAKEDGGITTQAVPAPPTNGSVISVKVGGTRTGTTAVSSLAGVVMGFYTAQTGGSLFDQCTSDAQGDCSITVPNTNTAPNQDRRFWVRQISAPSTHYTNENLGVGDTVGSSTYSFQTCAQLRAGSTCLSTGTGNNGFMLSTGTSNNQASGGIWQNSLNNPTFPAKCGINVALVLDFSNSVSDSQLVQLKAAANGFVDSLTGTPSQVGTFTFASNAPASVGDTLALTSVSTAAGATTVKNKITNYSRPTSSLGGTNWDRGLYQVAQSAATFDVAVVITDGNPTQYNSPVEGPGNRTRFREVENGIFSANAIKAENTKVIAFGVGDGVGNSGSGQNLRSISGPTLDSDYYQTDDYEAAGDALRELALGNCVGSISVVKQVVPVGAPANSTAGAVPQGGWTFTGTGSTGITFDSPNARQTAAGTGAANFPLTFAAGTTTGPVTLTETLQSGYTLHTINGNNATCTRVDTGAGVPATNSGATGFTVTAASTYPVSCVVYNVPPQPLASVILHKRWNVNGTIYNQGDQPGGLVAAALLNAVPREWDTEIGGFRQGDSVVVNEEALASLPLCQITSRRLTDQNGTTVDIGLPSTQILNAGVNNYTITNSVTCTTRLQLAKTVDGGIEPPPASDWTLTATPPTGSGFSGSTGVNQLVTAGVRYTLSENTVHPEYQQFVDPNAVLIPGSSGSWNCQELTADGGTVIPGFSDGLNGGVTVPFGRYVRCTAINQTATLRLVKEVVNDNGGTAVPADWQLTAAPSGTFPAGLPTETRTGAAIEDAQYFNVRPGVAYDLSESGGPPGYDNTAIECEIVSPRAATRTLTLRAGDVGTCWFVNNDRPAQLTLVKNVENGTTGATGVPADFTLTATGPAATVTGPGNSPDVTDQVVPAGNYVLSETLLPGYTPGTWSCTGGTLTGSTVTLPNGGDVTCEITNTAAQAHLTLVKTVTNDNGGTAEATDWTLSATGGPTTGISGPTDSAAVTDVAVGPGTYALAESGGPDGYAAGEWSCTGGTQNGSSVTVALGDDVTCTINNADEPAILTLVKVVDNGSTGATYDPADWTLSAGGPTPISGVGNSPAVTNQTVDAGSYALSESGGPDGYTASDWSCDGGTLTGASVAVPNGGDVTCTITNTAQPAHLTLVKVVDNGTTGGTAVPADWTLSAANGGSVVTGPGNSAAVTDQVVTVGDWALSESNGPDGYTAGDWSCTGGASFAGDTVTIAPGDDATCTITNTAAPLSLTLVKVVDNGDTGATTEATEWTLTAVNGASTISGATGTGPVTAADAIVGTYALSEAGPAGYDASGWVCEDATGSTDTSVTLDLGDHATCTITNTAQQPRLTLVKTVTNDNGGTAEPVDWTLTADGPTTGISGPVDDPAVTDVPVAIGPYDLSEADGPTGYTPGDWSCTSGLTGTTVTVALGDDITCTINNDDQPAQLTLVKTVDNGSTGATTEATAWTLSADGTTTPISGVTGSDEVTDAIVDAGDYTLAESGPAGYTAGAWSCGEGAQVNGAVVTVPSGGDVTCTIHNTAQQPQLTLIKTVTNDDGGTALPTDWTLTADGPTAGISGPVDDPAVTDVPVAIGDYDLAEADGPPNYTAGDWSCDGGTLDGSTVTVALGDDVTCTINNDDVAPVWRLAKTSDPASGSTVDPGDPVTYTVTATKVSGVDPTNLTVTDDLSDVLNNAVLVDGPSASTGTAVVSGSTMTWSIPTLSDTATVTYTVRVNDDAYGVTLANVVTGSGSETCPEADAGGGAAAIVAADVTAAADDDECDTVHYTPEWELTKTSDPASGSTVQPGSTITYTLTATNTSANATLSGATATDDLSDVLDHGSLVSVPDGATLDGTTLTWAVPDLEPGESATLTYQVRLDDDAWDVTVTNVATPGDGGGCPSDCTTDHNTPPKPHEPNLPNTGGPALEVVGVGLALLVGGGALLLATRRRRSH